MPVNESAPTAPTAATAEPVESASRRRADAAGRVARAWVDAWTSSDLDSVHALLANDVSVECNLGWPQERASLLETLHRLAAELTTVSTLSLTVATDRAAVLYDCHTSQTAGTIRLAEFLEVSDKHVTGVRRVYDLTAVDLLLPDLRHPATTR